MSNFLIPEDESYMSTQQDPPNTKAGRNDYTEIDVFPDTWMTRQVLQAPGSPEWARKDTTALDTISVLDEHNSQLEQLKDGLSYGGVCHDSVVS